MGFDLRSISRRPSSTHRRPYYLLDQLPVFHFGNTADPIYTGQCRGWRSACYIGGYAMESKCHLANQCVYKLRSGLNIRYHRISDVLRDVILPSDELPECVAVKYAAEGSDNDQDGDDEEDEICQDCSWWEFNE
jgi:putative lipase involved disintegration of autophagic bodies